MFASFTSHEDYLAFISQSIAALNNPSQSKKMAAYSDAIAKLKALNLDPLMLTLRPYYSQVGCPPKNQPQIFRSFILMLDQHEIALIRWVKTLASDDLLACLIGCSPGKLPPLGSYYDMELSITVQSKCCEKLSIRALSKQLECYHKSAVPKNIEPI